MTEGMKWMISKDDQNYEPIEFPSQAEAIAHGPSQLSLQPGTQFYVAPIINHSPRLHFEDVALTLLEQADFILGKEVPDHFFENVSLEAQKELENGLNEVLASWLLKHNLKLEGLIGKPVSVTA